MQLRPIAHGSVHQIPAEHAGPVRIPGSRHVPKLPLRLRICLLHPLGPIAGLMAAVLQLVPCAQAESVCPALQDSGPCHIGIIFSSLHPGGAEPFPFSAGFIQLLSRQVIHPYPRLGPGDIPGIGGIIAVSGPAPLRNGGRILSGGCPIDLGLCLISVGADIDITAQRPDLCIIPSPAVICQGAGIINLHLAVELTALSNQSVGRCIIQLRHVSVGTLHRIPANQAGIRLVPPAFRCGQLLLRFRIGPALRPLGPLAGTRIVLPVQSLRPEPDHGPVLIRSDVKLQTHIVDDGACSHLTRIVDNEHLPGISAVPAYLGLESIHTVCPFHSGPGRHPPFPLDHRRGQLLRLSGIAVLTAGHIVPAPRDAGAGPLALAAGHIVPAPRDAGAGPLALAAGYIVPASRDAGTGPLALAAGHIVPASRDTGCPFIASVPGAGCLFPCLRRASIRFRCPGHSRCVSIPLRGRFSRAVGIGRCAIT